MKPKLVFKIDGILTNPSFFVIPDMNLSSRINQMRRHEFSFEIHSSIIIDGMSSIYNAWVADSKKNDEHCGAPPDDELAQAGYPDLESLLANPSLIKLVLGGYLLEEFLAPLTWDCKSEIRYWFDEIIYCNVSGQDIELKGICYSL